MTKQKKIKDNVVMFPRNITKLEKQVEAILFAAAEPLDIETIEDRIKNSNNIKKILLNLQSDYNDRGINLICIKEKWSFRTSANLSNLMSLQKSTQKKLSRATIETLSIIVWSFKLRPLTQRASKILSIYSFASPSSSAIRTPLIRFTVFIGK